MPMQPAILGPARLGNVRLGYRPAALAARRAAHVTITLAGVDVRTRLDGLTIRDVLNDAPDTASLTIDGSEAPQTGDRLRIVLGVDPPRRLFDGALQTVDLTYEGLPDQQRYPCTAIDESAQANRRRPFGTWTDVSASTVAAELIATFAPAFTTAHVQAGLPLVTIVLDGSEGLSGALRQLANLIGGYFYVEDNDLHFFTTEATDAPDAIDATPGRFLDDPPITISRDASQLMTRAYGKGHGEESLADVDALDPILPIADAVMFNPLGGQAIALSQILDYTGVLPGGGGSLVGPGAAPSTAPTLTPSSGTGLGTGWYGYGVVDVTAAGKSLPSPVGTVQTTAALTPPSAPSAGAPLAGAPFVEAGAQDYVLTFVTPTGGETLPSAPSNSVTTTPTNQIVQVAVAACPPGLTQRNLYRRFNGAGTYKLVTAITNPAVTTYGDGIPNASLGAAAPSVDTSARLQITVTAVALGASPTTSREIYRTAVQTTQAAALTAQLKLLTTIANNTSTGPYVDSTADGSLGANAPTSDTSGITFAGGQVNAGSPSLLTASAAPFQSGGGWVLLGSGQAARYTGITGNTLTGIPASGPGAILTTVLYGSQVLPAPALTGVTGNALAIPKGTPVNLWVQRDDLTAQAEQAAIDLANGVTPADGVYEGPPIVDERRGEASLIALCDATLAKRSRPLVTVTYATRDPKTKSGKTIHVNLTTPPIGPLDLTIQEVTIDQIGVAAGTLPRFSVTASNERFSLDDLLRQLIAAHQAAG
jgi:hypothetical protein